MLRSDLWTSAFVRRHNNLGNICVISRKGLMVRDVSQDGDFGAAVDEKTGFTTRSLLVAPLDDALFEYRAGDRTRRWWVVIDGLDDRLALARAMLGRPRLLMLDEISMGLAPLVVARKGYYTDLARWAAGRAATRRATGRRRTSAKTRATSY